MVSPHEETRFSCPGNAVPHSWNESMWTFRNSPRAWTASRCVWKSHSARPIKLFKVLFSKFGARDGERDMITWEMFLERVQSHMEPSVVNFGGSTQQDIV